MSEWRFYRHRLPLSGLKYVLRLYRCFSLHQRDVQELLYERSNHETLLPRNIKATVGSATLTRRPGGDHAPEAPTIEDWA